MLQKMLQMMKTWRRVLPVRDINVEMVDVACQTDFVIFDVVKMEIVTATERRQSAPSN